MAAAAAQPILASALWTSPDTAEPSERPIKRRKLSTGLPDIDRALDDGLDYGHISCISAQSDAGASELVLGLLVTHLLFEADATATIIDTTLSFDIRKLHGLLVRALHARDGDAEADAMAALDRLKIMKVFDFVGLVEGVSEVREVLEAGQEAATVAPLPAGDIPLRGTIGDSEDEDEMLDVRSPPPPPLQPQQRPSKPSTETPGLLIISNITQPTAPLLKNNHTQGQSLLTSFMRSLAHLTRTHALCTILVNQTYTFSSSQPQQDMREEPPSIFSSCTLRPALGKTFTQLLDLHVLVHSVPMSAQDAKMVYGGGFGNRGGREAAMASVVEVLQDRYGGRVGRWAAFIPQDDGRLLAVP